MKDFMEKPVGWFWGVIFPILMFTVAVHDIMTQSVSVHVWIQRLVRLPEDRQSAIISGEPAVLLSSSFVCMALALHAMFWSGRIESIAGVTRVMARGLAVLGVAAFLGAMYWHFR